MTDETAHDPSPPVPRGERPDIQAPLNLVMRIKSPWHYQELARLLLTLNDLPEKGPVHQTLHKLGNVHAARFVFFEHNTRLAVITSFDGDLEGYLRSFVEHIGLYFDAILAHVEDAPPLPCQTYRDEFVAFVKAHNETAYGLFSAYPGRRVYDILDALAAHEGEPPR